MLNFSRKFPLKHLFLRNIWETWTVLSPSNYCSQLNSRIHKEMTSATFKKKNPRTYPGNPIAYYHLSHCHTVIRARISFAASVKIIWVVLLFYYQVSRPCTIFLFLYMLTKFKLTPQKNPVVIVENREYHCKIYLQKVNNLKN